MKGFDSIKAIILLPNARKHLQKVMRDLERCNYSKLIDELIETQANISSVNITVKSYFWASRTINNCHCLPRSIALYQRLKANGYKVEHKFGVNKQDKNLAAHAWVEHNKKPLNESKDLKQRFIVMNYPD